MTDHLPPHDSTAEKAVLGACLCDQGVLDVIRDIVRPADIYEESNRTIYESVLALHDCGADVDAVTVASDLKTRGIYDRIGGAAYLDQLVDAVPVSSHVEAQARIIAQMARLRVIATLTSRLEKSAMACDETAVVTLSNQLRNAVEGSTDALNPVSISDLMSQQFPEGQRWLVTGWWLSEACGFLGAWEKSSKSVMTRMFALSVASGKPFLRPEWTVPNPGPVLMIAEEDHARDLQRSFRRLAACLEIPWDGLPLYILSQSGVRLKDRRTRARLAQTVRRIKPVLIILDPWVRFASGLDEKDASEIGPLLHWLRQLQAENKTAIMVVHHLRKMQDGSLKGSLRRIAHQLRGSGDFAAWYDSLMAMMRLSDEEHRMMAFHRAADAMGEVRVTIRYDDAADKIEVWTSNVSEESRKIEAF